MFLDRKCQINSDFVKMAALLSMTADHLARVFENFQYSTIICDSIGRLAFPIFAFLIALNLNRSKDPDIYKKYIFRLLITGLTAIVVDYFLGGFFRFNIMFTFLLAVLFIYIVNRVENEKSSVLQKVILLMIAMLAFLELSILVEYSVVGFLYVVLFYFLVRDENRILLALLLVIAIFLNAGHLAVTSTLAVTIFLLFYKDCFMSKGRIIKKWWMFYMYYPLHRGIIYLI